MLPDLNRVIEQVSKEKGIDRQIIVEALEQAMLSAAKRTFGPDKNIEAKFNPEVAGRFRMLMQQESDRIHGIRR